MNPDPPSTSKSYAAEWLALAVALAIAAALIGFELMQGHANIDALERDRLAVQARVIEDNIGQQLDGISQALTSVRAEHLQRGSERSGGTSARLKILSDAIPGVRNMFRLDAGGTVVASSDAALLGRNFRDNAYFALSTRERNSDRLYVSPPFESVLGNFVVLVGRVLHDPDGNFEGLVAAGLDNRYFEIMMRSVLYAADMQAALADTDGKVFVGTPRATASRNIRAIAPGFVAGSGELLGDAATPRAGAVETGSRLVALREVTPAALRMNKPLLVVVSRSVAAVFGPWRRHVIELGGFLTALLAATSLSLYRSQWRRRQFDRLEASATEERRLGAERLELALRGAELGLWDWDVPNDRFNQNELTRLQLGYAPEEIGPEGRAWRSLFHPDDAERVLATIEAHFRQRTEAYECEFRVRHKAGHWVWLLSRGKVVERAAGGKPLRMAGTHMDVTERKRIEFELQRLNDRLTQLSTTDGLTEVGNRRLFDQTLSAEWARAARKRESVALLMIDIDHFKNYNDSYGHPAGDECLRRVARLISETVQREGELVARYGGEEFALLLPGADLAAARTVAERCLAAVAGAKIEHRASPDSPWVTLSIGVATRVAAPATLASALVEAADAALYRAKRGGRGRYEC